MRRAQNGRGQGGVEAPACERNKSSLYHGTHCQTMMENGQS
jgi:hypothetical protein